MHEPLLVRHFLLSHRHMCLQDIPNVWMSQRVGLLLATTGRHISYRYMAHCGCIFNALYDMYEPEAL